MTIAQRLAEREKELACIYSICLLAAAAPEPEAIAEGLARALCSAMQYEVSTSCTVLFNLNGNDNPILVHRGHYRTYEPLQKIYQQKTLPYAKFFL